MDYKYDQVTSTTWQRANRIVVDHPIPGTGRHSSISFVEEIAVALPDGRYAISPVGVLSEALILDGEHANVNEAIQMVDPITGEPIPDQFITYGMAQAMMYSLYLHVAKKRDAMLEGNQ